MADEQHATLLRRSVREWNRWRVENPQVTPDLAGAGLRGLDLSGANLSGAADLRGAVLSKSSLSGSRPAGANLFKAVLDGADLDSADLRGVRFLDCGQLTTARNWQWAYGNADLECGVPIPQRPGALVRAPQASTSRGRSIVLINIVTRCVSSGATKSADSSVNSVDLQRTLSHTKTRASRTSLCGGSHGVV